MISVNKWQREMQSLDIFDKNIPTLLLKNMPFAEAVKIKNKDMFDHKYIDHKDAPALIYDLRKAAECHKIVRRNIQNFIKPGVKLIDICQKVENNIVELFGKNNLEAGIAFPVGLSLNNVIAHCSAAESDNYALKYDDLLKLDFGTHCNGYIIDSAFSVAFNPEYQDLLDAAREAIWTGIKLSGVDASIFDISCQIK